MGRGGGQRISSSSSPSPSPSPSSFKGGMFRNLSENRNAEKNPLKSRLNGVKKTASLSSFPPTPSLLLSLDYTFFSCVVVAAAAALCSSSIFIHPSRFSAARSPVHFFAAETLLLLLLLLHLFGQVAIVSVWPAERNRQPPAGASRIDRERERT